MEDVSLDRFDTMQAFDEFYKVFDRDYQYDPEQELPARMEELVTGFHRQRAEPLRLYVRRLDALVVKLGELKIEWPEPFLGWILLHRSAMPAWQIPNVRSSMGKGFSRIAVRDALYHMFGPDSKLNSRDVLRVTQEGKHTGTEHVNLAAEDWADESPEESHEYEFEEQRCPIFSYISMLSIFSNFRIFEFPNFFHFSIFPRTKNPHFPIFNCRTYFLTRKVAREACVKDKSDDGGCENHCYWHHRL